MLHFLGLCFGSASQSQPFLGLIVRAEACSGLCYAGRSTLSAFIVGFVNPREAL